MIKTFDIFVRGDNLSNSLSKKIKERLSEASFIYDEINPDLVISIGGDGTFLKAVHHHLENTSSILYCGIHTGTLGFYTDFLASEVDDLLDRIIAQEYYVINYNLIEAKIHYDHKIKSIFALNEVRIENVKNALTMDVFIDDIHFESFRGNGLCFSSPTGSTGYAKSLGGAVLHPKTKAMQMMEVASINNIAYRSLGSPVILSKDHQVKIHLKAAKGAILGYDNFAEELVDNYPELDYLTFKLSDKTVNMARFRTFHFLNRVKKNFIDEDY